MAFSYVDYSVSTTTTGPFSFAAIDGYLSVDHIKVYKNGTLLNPAQYTLEVDPPQITLDIAAISGDTIRIRRVTPNTEDGVIVPFQDGSILRSRDLRTSQLQALFISQEFADIGILIPGGGSGPSVPNAGDLIVWDGTEFVFSAPGNLGVEPGTYGDIVVSGAGNDWSIRDGVYGNISVSSGGSVWTLTGGSSFVPDADYGEIVVSNNGTTWELDDSVRVLPPDGTYGDVVVSGSGSVWTVSGASVLPEDGAYGQVVVSNDGVEWTVTIGATSGLPIKTGTGGALEVGAFGTSAGQFAEGNHTHSDATTSASGFMSASDKTKLDGVETGAQVNTVTSVAGRTGAVSLTKSDVGLDNVANVDTTNASNITSGTLPAGQFNDTTHGSRSGGTLHADATTSVSGFMSASDKTKLDGVEAGAEVNVNADWNATTGDAQILNKPTLATVATSGDYTDLSNLPTLGTAAAEDVGAFVASTAVSTFGLSLIDDADASTARSTLELGSAATSASTDFATASHTHGSINNDGTIGSAAGLVVKTGASGAVTTLGMGTAGQVLKVNSTATDIEWATDDTASGSGDVSTDTIWDAKGDLAVGTGADTAQKLTAGSNGQYLIADSAQTTGLKWGALAVGTTSGLPIKTGTDGALEAGAFGTSAGQFAEGNHTHAASDITSGSFGSDRITDGAVVEAKIGTGAVTNGKLGDLSVSTGKIQDDAVTYAKMQNVSATDRILGRATAGAGDVEEITCTSVGRNILSSATSTAALSAVGGAAFSHTHTITDNYCGHIEAPEVGKVYTIDLASPYSRTLTRIDMITGAGTIDYTLKNGANTVETADGVGTSPYSDTALSNTTLAQGGKLTLTIDAVAGGEDLQFSIRYNQIVPGA